MYTSMYRPITAPACCEKMTIMTKSQKALSFQCFIMVMQMTKHDHANDHMFTIICQCDLRHENA